MHVDVSIVDVHAKAIMRQRFTNSLDAAADATYTLSMLASSAVCGFEMIRGDGTRVVGRVQEKQAAKRAFDTAIAQGKTASLGEEQTKDLFSIKVGNILPAETVTINVTFVTPLIDDERRDQVRFTFPRAYTQRYGTPPTANVADMSSRTGLSQNFSINVSVQMPGAVRSISCPSSHPIEMSLGKPEGATVDASIPDSNFASVKLTNPTPSLERDFILVITATRLDSPRCFVESSEEGTTAVALTFVPRFNLPDGPNDMEYIFLVDRSGSMEGTSIALVQQALVVLLRGLPTKKTKFNIFSFGDRTTSLWPASKDYTQKTLDQATTHVDKMKGDYGGTEIALALRTVFGTLPKERKTPVSVFLLTDGGAWDVENCQKITREALASPGEFVRVFTVGIGNSASTNTVDSIARAGEGLAIYVQDNEPMTGKLARLVRASRAPCIQNLRVLWPGGGNSASDEFEMVEAEGPAPQTQDPIRLFEETADDAPKDVGPPPKPEVDPLKMFVPAIQQSPLAISGLFPGTRSQIYGIISASVLPLGQFPSLIKVCGTVAHTGTPVELEVEITPSSSSLIHTLAAQSLIADREDGKHEFPASVSFRSDVLDAHLEADIVRLGTKYGLTSKHTSYIAIDEKHPKQPLGIERNVPQHQTSQMPRLSSAPSPMLGQAALHKALLVQAMQRQAAFAPQPAQGVMPYSGISSFSPPSLSHSAVGHMGLSQPTPQYLPAGPSRPSVPPQRCMPMPSSTASLVHLQTPLYSPSAALRQQPVPAKLTRDCATMLGEDEDFERNKISKRMRRNILVGSSVSYKKGSNHTDLSGQDYSHDSLVANGDNSTTAIARLQRFDGSFLLSERLLKTIGSDKTAEQVSRAIGGAQHSNDVLATCIAMLWLEKEAYEEGQDMIGKALDWLRASLSQDMLDELKQRVVQFVFTT